MIFMKVYHTLKPIYNYNSKILILGSMPSIISRENNFYYANKNNRFWTVIEKLFNVKFNNNQEKELFLLNNNIALWDTIESCDIINSQDSSIKNIKVNDINNLISKTNIKYIFCTGKTSYNIFVKYIKTNIQVYYLPSTSSANANYSLEKLLEEYKIIIDCLNK
jgi:TDG/mug DNA glycosylase family protein